MASFIPSVSVVIYAQGKRLFRAVAEAIVFIVGQNRAVLQRKAVTRDQDAAEFQLAYPLYFEQCKAWVAKVTKATINSLLQVLIGGSEPYLKVKELTCMLWWL